MNVFQNTSTIIYSVDRGNRSELHNALNRKNAVAYMKKHGMSYTVAIGGYVEDDNGAVTEISYIVHNPTAKQAALLKEFAFKMHNQDSILHINSSNHTTLIFKDGSRKVAGRMRVVTEESKGDYYTKIGGTYYAAAPYRGMNGVHKPSN